MGLFGSNKTYEMPAGHPEQWTVLDVKHWIKHIGMAKHKGAFRVLSGQELIALTEQDVQMMCKSDIDSKYVYRMLLRLKGEPEPSRVPASVAAKERAIQHLFQWAGEDANITEFREFLDGAGTVTVGLMATCESMSTSSIPVIVGLVFKIYRSSRDAQVNIYNCRILRYLSVDVLRALHSAGPEKLITTPVTVYADIQDQLEKALMLVRSCSKPGWLVRMAFAGRIDEEFADIHECLVETLEESKLDDLYGHAKLPPTGDYTDCCSALQKALGSQGGNMRAALAAFAESGQGYDAIKTALSCDDDGLRSEMGYITPALAVIDKMLPPSSPAGGPPPRPLTPPPASVPTAPRTPPRTTMEEAPPVPIPISSPIIIEPHGGVVDPDEEEGPAEDGEEEEHGGEVVLDVQAAAGERESILGQEQPRDGQEQQALLSGRVSRPLNIYEIFLAFCNYGTRQETVEMDGSHFSKFCRDCRLVGKDLSSTEVDLLFARVKTKGQRRIVYEEFVEALTLLADKKKMSLKQLTDGVLSSGGPATTATRAMYNRLHDDKANYTGVYARGGPTNVDTNNQMSLDKVVLRTDPKEFGTPRMMMNGGGGGGMTPRGFTPRGNAVRSTTAITPRSASQVAGMLHTAPAAAFDSGGGARRRGISLTPRATVSNTSMDLKVTPRSTPPLSARAPSSKHSSPGSAPRLARNMITTPRSSLSSSLRPFTAPAGDRANVDVPWQDDPDSRAELLRVYTSFAAFGNHHAVAKAASQNGQRTGVEMENKQFVKLVKDAGLVGGHLNVTRLDIIFSKVKAKGQRKINFAGFERALTLLADERGYTLNQVYNTIVSTAGPQLNNATTPEFVKYHDDRNTYTGVYARGGPTNVDRRITLDKMVTRNDDVYMNKRTPRFIA
mmetsp:Transcript_29164/g.82238  ORF Transcript_29164/g.82238 Transcript_29164/m.82238 type:complete len:896 (-) Transcript_29164:675-3362(-)